MGGPRTFQALRRWTAIVTSVALAAVAASPRAAERSTVPRSGQVLPTVVAAVEAARRGARVPSHLVPAFSQVRMFPRRYRIPARCIAHDASSKVMSDVCRAGDVQSHKLLVLFGDSHAFMWLPAILTMAKRDHWAIVPLIRFGCTPGLWVSREGPDACRAWYRWAVGWIRRLHPRAALLGGSVGEQPSYETRLAVEGVVSAGRTLASIGPTVVIGDPEGLASSAIPCLERTNASLAPCMSTWSPSALAAYDEIARASHASHVGFIRTRGFVCYLRQCPAVVGHTIVWMDNSHLTGLYSAQLAGPFRDGFLAALP